MIQTPMWRAATCAAAIVLGACGKEPPPRRDTLLTQVPAPQEAPPAAPAAPAASRIGSLPLTRDVPAPPDGQCSIDASDIEKRITYRVDSPTRAFNIGVGDSTRAFVPTFIEVRGSQSFAGVEESESIYASFEHDGTMLRGTREWSSAGKSERAPAADADVAALKDLAGQIMGWCK